MIMIRLTQMGSKNRKTYRIIAIDKHKRRDGKAIEILGYYNPLVKPPEISVNKERVKYWKDLGAQISPKVQGFL